MVMIVSGVCDAASDAVTINACHPVVCFFLAAATRPDTWAFLVAALVLA